MPSESFDLKYKVSSEGVQETKKQLSEFTGTSDKAGESMDLFKTYAKMAATALAAWKIAETTVELAGLYGRFESINNAFEAFVDKANTTQLSLSTLRTATKGMVSDTELLTAANNALALGLPVNQLNDLFEAATVVGNAMGRTTLEAVNDLATGIGRQSRLILDNLGIIVRADEAQAKYAASLGKTASQLTDAEKKTAFMTEAMRALNEHASTLEGSLSETSINVQRLSAAIDNAKISIGEFAANAINPLFEIYDSLTLKQNTWWRDTEMYLGLVIYKHGQAATEIEGFWDGLEEVYGDDTKAMIDYLKSMGIELDANVQSHIDWAQMSMDAIGQIAQDTQELRYIAEQSYQRMRDEQISIMKEIRVEWEDHYTDLYDVQDNWLQKIENTITGHYDDLINKAQTESQREISIIEQKYDDMLEAERAYLNEIQNSRRTDLEDLEYYYLQDKAKLDSRLAAKKITQYEYEDSMQKLEAKYRDERAKLNDQYRLQELEEIIRLRDVETDIESQKASEIKAEEQNLRDEIARLNKQKERDMQEFQTKLQGILDTLGTGFEDIIGEITGYLAQFTEGIEKVSETMGETADNIDEYVDDINTSLSQLQDKTVSVDLEYNVIVKTGSGGGGGGGGGGGSTPSPTPSPTPTPTPEPPDEYAQHGFQGWVTSPTRFLAGEAGAEYVSITPRNRTERGLWGSGNVPNVNINLPNVTSVGDVSQVRDIWRTIMLELSGER